MTDDAPAAKARRLLPLYDDSAPIVCTIGAEEKADRIEIMNHMRTTMTALERTETGLLLTFARTDAIESDVRRFAVDEKRCCQFWGFAIVESDDELVLRWDGPPNAGPLLDTLEEVLLRSDAPIEGVAGLL